MCTRTLLTRLAAGLGAALLVVLPLASARAAEPRDPIGIFLPSGQGIEIGTDPITIIGHTGAQDTPANQIPDFLADFVLFQCGYSVSKDGTVHCGLPGKAQPTPTPTPNPGPTPPGPTPTPSNGGTAGNGGNGSGDGDDVAGPGGEPSGRGAAGEPDGSAAGDGAGDPEGDGTGAGNGTDGDGATAAGDVGASAGAGSGGDGDGPAVAKPLSTKEVLGLGVTAFGVLALVGRRGLAAASAASWRRRYPKAADDAEGSVTFADSAMYEFDPELAGAGDKSRWWRFISGWILVDRLSRLIPNGLSLRAPLLARISADGTYLRAVLGAAWLLLPVAGFLFGIRAAHDSAGYPLAPSLALTAVLLVIAVLDATAGFFGVLGFVLGLLAWGPGDLGLAPSLRGFLGLAALWFAIPLIASTARPLRRTRERSALYTWDRIADGVIAALVSGWAVQGVVGGLPGLSGHLSPIDSYADRLALIAIAAVAVRVAIEEVATRLFPERLKVVDTGMLPDPAALRMLTSAILRTGVFLFVAWPFIGNCWQLWVGGLIFALPQLLDLVADRLPNSERMFQVIPRGVAMVLFMIVVGILAGRWVESVVSDGPEVVQNGFVLLALPGLLVSVVSLFGRDGPVPARSWRNELLGLLAVTLSVALVVQGY